MTLEPLKWADLMFKLGPSYGVEFVFGPMQGPDVCCFLERGEYSTIPGTSKRVVDVPSPATLALLGSGLAWLAGYGLVRCRRRV
jgi:hypothetical protein